MLNVYAQNIPYYDDFLWGVIFLKDHQSLDFGDRFFHLFSQHNQHRILWLRGAVVSITALKGFLDFRILVLVGNLGFLGLSLLYMKVLSSVKTSPLYLLPIPFIVHDLSTYHNQFVSYGVPNMTVIFFATLCFYWVVSKKTNRSILAIFVGSLGTFTNGSGVLIMPIATLGLILMQRSPKKILTHALASMIVLWLYFLNYKTDYNEITLSWQALPYFLEFMAAYLPFAGNPPTQVLMLAFLSFAIYLSLKKFPLCRIHTFVALSTAFLMGSGLLATLFRLIHDIPIPDWYYIYSYAFISLVYIWLLHTFQTKALRFLFFTVFMGLSVFSYFHEFRSVITSIDALSNRLKADAVNYKNHNNWAFLPLKAGLKEEQKWQESYDILLDKGLLKLPHIETPSSMLPIENSSNITLKKEQDHYKITLEYIQDSAWKQAESMIFVKNKNSGDMYFAGMNHYPNPLIEKLKTLSWFNAQGVGILPKKYSKNGLPAGRYDCGIYLKNKAGQEKCLRSNEEIVIENW